MTMIETGHTGAKRTSWSEANPRDLMLKIRKKHPGADLAESFTLFLEAMEKPSNRKYLVGILEYFHANAFNALVRDEVKVKVHKPAKVAAVPVEAKRKDAKIRSAAVVNDVVTTQAKIVLLDMVTPNGKPLRHCTGPECAAAGGWLVKIAPLVGNKIVGDVLSEAKLHALFTA